MAVCCGTLARGKRADARVVAAPHLGSIGDISWLPTFALPWFGAMSMDCWAVGEALLALELELSAASWIAEESSSTNSSLFPSEWRRFSRPSTRFNKASRTSVLGPLFLGTASGGVVLAGKHQIQAPFGKWSIP